MAQRDPARNHLSSYLPCLRRYSRALAGSKQEGDQYVHMCLSAVLLSQEKPPSPPHAARVYLFKKLHEIWKPLTRQEVRHGSFSPVDKKLHKLGQLSRQVLLLTALEEFSTEEVAEILCIPPAKVRKLVTSSVSSMRNHAHARVLIIEDDPFISIDLQHIVKDMGHDAPFIATTYAEAIALSEDLKPELVLADLRLADGSSGMDAVEHIRSINQVVPVIFITAYPEQLLDERCAATYVINKPYTAPSIQAICNQALFNR